jgi:ferredoxin
MPETYTITLKDSDTRFDIRPGETILDAAARNHITLPHGCRTGVCGVCISKVLSGNIEYPGGQPLSLFEEDLTAGMGLCCVGIARGDLLLEVINLGEDYEPWDQDDTRK